MNNNVNRDHVTLWVAFIGFIIGAPFWLLVGVVLTLIFGGPK